MFFKCDECGKRYFLPSNRLRCRIDHIHERARKRECLREPRREEHRHQLEQSRHTSNFGRNPSQPRADSAHQSPKRVDDGDDMEGFTDLRQLRAPSFSTQHYCSRDDRHETTDSSSIGGGDCSSDD